MLEAKIDNHFQVQESNLVIISLINISPSSSKRWNFDTNQNNPNSHDPIDSQITPPGAYFPRELPDSTLDTATRAASRTIAV